MQHVFAKVFCSNTDITRIHIPIRENYNALNYADRFHFILCVCPLQTMTSQENNCLLKKISHHFSYIVSDEVGPNFHTHVFTYLSHSRLILSFWKCSQGLKDNTPIIDKKAKVPWIILVQKLFQNVERK